MDKKVTVNNTLMVVFGGAISVLLIWVLGVGYSSGKEISGHKDVASDRYARVQVEIANLAGEVKTANTNFEYVKINMSEDIRDLKDLIRNQNKSWASTPLDTSTLRFPNE